MNYIPNLLTLLRISLVPVLILLLNNHAYNMALWVFVLAGLTDGLDGFIAKRYGYLTQLGAVLDPLADKFLLLSSFVMLTIAGDLPFWLLIVAAFRELIIITGVMLLTILYDHFEMKPIISSKINTFMQIMLVVLVLVEKSGLLNVSGLISLLIWVVAATTITSGFQYVLEWVIRKERDKNPT